MNHAAATSSIISNNFLVELVKEKFKLGPETTCEIIRIGVNHTYLIQTRTDKYVLRLYTFNWRTKLEILEEIKLLLLLNENNIGISYPIQDQSGAYIQKINAIEGERFAVLFSYAKGEVVKNLSKNICYNLGIQIAKLHQVTINKSLQRKSYNPDTLVHWAYLLAKDFFSESLEEVQYLKKAYEEMSAQFEAIDTSKLRQGIVHLDLWSDNMKIDSDSKITMFDFDNCGNGHLFLDIGYTLMLLFKEEADKDIYAKKAKLFCEAYESISPLSEEEKKLIPYGGLAIWLHYTGVHVQRFNDFSSLFFSKAFLTHWIGFAKSWMAYNNVKI